MEIHVRLSNNLPLHKRCKEWGRGLTLYEFSFPHTALMQSSSDIKSISGLPFIKPLMQQEPLTHQREMKCGAGSYKSTLLKKKNSGRVNHSNVIHRVNCVTIQPPWPKSVSKRTVSLKWLGKKQNYYTSRKRMQKLAHHRCNKNNTRTHITAYRLWHAVSGHDRTQACAISGWLTINQPTRRSHSE